MFLDSLSPYSIESQGTDFARALQEAHDAFERGGVEDDDQVRTTRVILVLSDGEDQEKGALELAKKFSGEGVKIFTMAFGTERGGMIPIRDERGYLRSYKKDRSGKEVISQVKGEFLKDLARAGGGAFHFASFGGNEARAIKEDIDRLQKAEFASSMSTQYEEKFQLFLLLALVFLALDLVLGERAPGERVWRGRFESGLSVLALMLVFGGMAPEARAGGFDEFRGIRENNRAVGDLKSEKPVEALDGFSKALGDLPDDPTVHYNLGTSFQANKDAAKAASEYDVALTLNPAPELAFKINFNRALAYAELKKYDEALSAFQAALILKPDSKEVKKNIELLLQSGDGDGQSDNQQQKPNDKPDDKSKDPKQNQQQPNQQQQPQTGPTPKPTPRPFKSEQLSQQDVGRILEELKRQEDQIREKMQREGGKDAPRDKDW
jgi:tetratricopeptide (TPR) repeat protein